PSAADPPRYALPPKEIIEAFDAPSLPTSIVSPSRQAMALEYRRNNPTIAELAQPFYRLAGARINPKTHGPRRTDDVYAIKLKRIADGAETKVPVPPQPNLSNVHFSPDGSRLSFLATRENRIELWVADVGTGTAREVSGTDRLNAAAGDPCEW